MTHNGIEIDQYLLLAIYPCAIFFGIGFVARKTSMKESIKYLLQALTCFSFAGVYFTTIPNGGAQGLAIVLAMFGVILLLMAKRNAVFPESEEQQQHSAANAATTTTTTPPATSFDNNPKSKSSANPDSDSDHYLSRRGNL